MFFSCLCSRHNAKCKTHPPKAICKYPSLFARKTKPLMVCVPTIYNTPLKWKRLHVFLACAPHAGPNTKLVSNIPYEQNHKNDDMKIFKFH